MWRPWSKVSALIHNSSPAPSSSSSSSPAKFSCSTFKDIQHLCSDDSLSDLHIPSRKSSSVFNRVRIATSLIRNWSSSRHLASNLSDQTPSLEPQQDSEKSEKSLTKSELGQNDESTSLTTATSEPELEQNYESTSTPQSQDAPITIPGAEKRIVLYFTSLRVVRSTFEDCKSVRTIINGFPVSIEERDLSMDSSFSDELQALVGKSKLKLPRVFIGGRYIGGADEIRQLHETGELKKIIADLPVVEAGVCEGCAGYSFVVCEECYGSHKVHREKNGFRICSVCNENGLIRCPSCSSALF